MEKTTALLGDYVQVHLTKEIYEGVFLDAPESEKGMILLKLDTGYNIGFNKKDVLKIKVLRKFKETNEEIETKNDRDKPNIAMIITGGTISSRLDPKSGAVSWLTFRHNYSNFILRFSNMQMSAKLRFLS